MEVSLNKVLVTMTDLIRTINSKNPSVGGGVSAVTKAKDIPKGIKTPDFPIDDLGQVIILNRHLRDGEFRVFLVKFYFLFLFFLSTK